MSHLCTSYIRKKLKDITLKEKPHTPPPVKAPAKALATVTESPDDKGYESDDGTYGFCTRNENNLTKYTRSSMQEITRKGVTRESFRKALDQGQRSAGDGETTPAQAVKRLIRPKNLAVPMASTAEIIQRFSSPHPFHRYNSLPQSTKSILKSAIRSPSKADTDDSPKSSNQDSNASYVDMNQLQETSPFNRGSFVVMSERNRNQYSPPTLGIETLLSEASVHHPANIPMRVVQSYTPKLSTGNMLQVNKGLVINAMYKTRDWVHVKAPDGRDGYVPYLCLHPVEVQHGVTVAQDFTQQFPEGSMKSQTLDISKTAIDPADDLQNHGNVSEDSGCREDLKSFLSVDQIIELQSHCCCCEHSNYLCMNMSRNSQCASRLSQDASMSHDTAYGSRDTLHQSQDMLHIKPSGDPELLSTSLKPDSNYLTVLFGYKASNKTDISVKHQEVVKLLNDKNSDWVWVRKDNGLEGFIPRNYTVNLTLLNLDPATKTTYL